MDDCIGALNVTLQCNDATGLTAAQALAPVAIDNCGGVTYSKTSGPFVPGSCPQTGTYTNTWTAKDACNNVSTVFTQVITIQNTIAPVVPANGASTVACPPPLLLHPCQL
jgi:hypothetical protein